MSNGLGSRARGGSHRNEVGIVSVGGALDAIAGGEERVEALDECRVRGKQARNTGDDAGGINTG